VIRKFIATAIKALLVLWLVGWVLTVGPRAAWTDVAHTAQHVYAWVHAATAHRMDPPTPVPPS
jgi:hypothetical protein